MRVRIVVDPGLHGLEGRIQRTTFEAIHRLKNLGVPVGDHYNVVGDPFISVYFLRFTDDRTGEPNCLYVSEEVKAEFYAGREFLDIRPV
jgi:hypothetical protein